MMTLTSYETKVAEHRRLINSVNRCAWMHVAAGCCKPARQTRRSAVTSRAVAMLVLTVALLSTFVV